MAIVTKVVFGFGVLLEYDSIPWLQEDDYMMQYEDNFLEWVFQKNSYLSPSEMIDSSLKD